MSTELTNAIDQIIQQKTFSLEGVDAIKTLKIKALALEESVIAKDRRIAELEQLRKDFSADITTLNDALKIARMREDSLVKREANIAQLERTSAVADARSGCYTDIFNKMFANRQFREHVIESTQVPVPYNNGMTPTTHTANSSKQTDTEEK